MPLYTYECAENHVTEHLVSAANRPATIECETCAAPAAYAILEKPSMRVIDRRPSASGLRGDPAFQDTKGRPVIKTRTRELKQ